MCVCVRELVCLKQKMKRAPTCNYLLINKLVCKHEVKVVSHSRQASLNIIISFTKCLEFFFTNSLSLEHTLIMCIQLILGCCYSVVLMKFLRFLFASVSFTLFLVSFSVHQFSSVNAFHLNF
uniref:Uncharacterized protein n=1 Tax=Trichobilharzia regenti TaxID=157069 RepID=A0AA85J9X2_TRIRE|nr:unnamed protein product [Trichobilharzia regenti]